jgi:hypothetical protein
VMRATDEQVHKVLGWARNYGEIESYKSVANSGRRWRIELPAPTTVEGYDGMLATRMPQVLMFTSREAIAFGFGCVAAGSRPYSRGAVARAKWGWGAEEEAMLA